MRTVLMALMLFFLPNLSGFGQKDIKGSICDEKGHSLSFVNVGIRGKNFGTCSDHLGNFSLKIPDNLRSDSLTFSLIGYKETSISVKSIAVDKENKIVLASSPIYLKEVPVTAKKLIEKKFGVTKYKPLMHFVDASVQQSDIFEIAQVIHLPKSLSKITSVNLFLNENRKDSALFRINFYELTDGTPGKKINTRELLFRKPIQAGWLSFDLKNKSTYLKGDIVAAIEFIPSGNGSIKYEVKVGGTTKSFVRTSSFGEWQIPPHHYRLYATAVIDPENTQASEDLEEVGASPTSIMYSTSVRDSFYIFVSLPKSYSDKPKGKFPVVYLLDANVYFDFLKGDPENIIVGIGYKNAFLADSLREKDYTYPRASVTDSMPISGGGVSFAHFIENELIPSIDKQYRTDSTNRTLMGHSLGGYFTLFALNCHWKGKEMFSKYVAASPSLDYSDNYLIKQFEALKETATKPKNLLITSGSEEKLNEINALVDLLKNSQVKVKSVVFPKMGHMETAVTTFKAALTNEKGHVK
jgi:predicted alpha/beta superfamily hydrolase